MARKMPKRPKLKKYPKKPRQSASPQTWMNYEERKKQVDNDNREKISEYNKKCTSIKSAENAKKRIIQSVAGIGRVSKVKWK